MVGAAMGAVLTGGQSSRMGRDKSLIDLGGVALAVRVARALGDGGCDPVVAVGGDGAALEGLGLRFVADHLPGAGPLGGVRTALASCPPEVAGVVVAACDLPWLDGGAVRALVGATGALPAPLAVVASGDGRRQQHLCWWAREAAPVLAAAWEEGERSLRGVLARLGHHVREVAVTSAVVADVDRPSDLPAGYAAPVRPPEQEPMDIPEIDPTSFAAAHADGAAVLDVRTPEEYDEGHVPGAVLIPLAELAVRLAEVPAGDPLYVICRSGARSAQAVEMLRGGGTDSVNVAGGTLAWIEAGRPVVTGARPS